MKILFDYQTFSLQKYGGISRYFTLLAEQIDKTTNHSAEISTKYTNNYYLKNSMIFGEDLEGERYTDNFIKKIENSKIKGRGKLKKIASKLVSDSTKYNMNLSIDKLKEGKFDIFHPTYYENYFLKFLHKKPFVLTVYDMAHETLPEYFGFYNHFTNNKKELINKADKIIAISEYTKNDIIQIYNIDPEKIEVIYLASELKSENKNYKKIELPKNYLLYVGNRFKNKNFYMLALSLKKILLEYPELKIIVSGGGGGFLQNEIDYLRHLEILDKFITMPADNDTLIQLYTNALAFVYPSIYEGFGIPLLEAMEYNCPIIASHSTSIPEIADNAAIYFDPLSITSIQKSIYKILENKDLRKDLIQLGSKRIKNFNWNKTVKQTINLYQSLI